MAVPSQTKHNVSHIHVTMAALFTASIWFLSYTILFPLFITPLKLARRCRNKLFSLIDNFIDAMEDPDFRPLQKKLFKHLPTDPNRNIKVLEVGVGPGVNFEFYSSNYELTLLDMDEKFETEARENLKKYPDLKVEKVVFGMAEDMREIPDLTYDVVVCTHLLCSVRNITEVLKEISRVLKPGGKFLYMEHISYPSSSIPFWIQTLMSLMWKVFFNGCNLNRLTHNTISQVFRFNSYQIFYPLHVSLFIRPQAIGVASQPRMLYFKSL